MIKNIIKCLKLKDEMIFFISFALAVIMSVFMPVSFKAIDFKVIALLYSLMLIALAFEKYHLVEFIATSILKKAQNQRQIGFFMILTTAFCAMFMTNDVALFTMVPITFAISDKAEIDPKRTVVLQTIAANIGSSFTPFGNPQNLFLFTVYDIDIWAFMRITFLLVFLGICFTLALNLRSPKGKITYEKVMVSLSHKKKLIYFLVLFIIVLSSVLGFLDYRITTALVLLSVFLIERKLLLRADYYLLGTFICFFIIIDHIQDISCFRNGIKVLLDSKRMVFVLSALISQVISNVPSAVLVSAFTDYYDALLLGVSVGGMGTMIASMANLISYKLYIKKYPAKSYTKLFYQYNFLGFALFSILFIFLL